MSRGEYPYVWDIMFFILLIILSIIGWVILLYVQAMQ